VTFRQVSGLRPFVTAEVSGCPRGAVVDLGAGRVGFGGPPPGGIALAWDEDWRR
jgi:hypothetical protein